MDFFLKTFVASVSIWAWMNRYVGKTSNVQWLSGVLHHLFVPLSLKELLSMKGVLSVTVYPEFFVIFVSNWVSMRCWVPKFSCMEQLSGAFFKHLHPSQFETCARLKRFCILNGCLEILLPMRPSQFEWVAM